jgi:putative protease
MHILAPADSAREAGILIEAGAGAIYAGYDPPALAPGRSPLLSLNRRSFAEAQVDSASELAALARVCREGGVPLWVTFNAPSYPPWIQGEVLAAARECRDAGVTGFIVSDPLLMGEIRREGLGGICLSTMAGAFNSRAVAFFRGLGADRVTIPRDLTMGAMRAMAEAHPDLPFEIFILFGACANLEPFCRWIHRDPARVWSCVKTCRAVATGPAEAGRRAAGVQEGWGGLSRAWACGLCALADLPATPNLEGLKIVGRGAPLPRKLQGVGLVRDLLREREAGGTRGEFLAEVRRAKAAASGTGCLPRLCYYPEYLP